jgi:small subunit ribosomal protein S17
MKTHRRRLVGKVTSNKMTKTVVVQVESRQRHPLYGKVVHKAARFKAHDEMNCQLGDSVQIVESRPISKEVHWVVEAILNRGYHVELPADEPATQTATEPPTLPATQPEGGAA